VTTRPEVRREIERLLRDGLTNREVAKLTGVHPVTVSSLRRALGIPPWRPPEPEHGTRQRARRCDCEACRAAQSRYVAEKSRERKRKNKAMPAERRAALAEHRDLVRRETSQAATVRGPWRAEEIALALDYRHSALEIAQRLGRSITAVNAARARYGKRPTTLPYRPKRHKEDGDQ